MITQKQLILNSNAPLHSIAGSTYKGKSPVYVEGKKVGKGIPFVKVK